MSDDRGQLKSIRQWYSFYSVGHDIGQHAVGQFTQALPENLKSNLPGIEEIEHELGGEG